MNLSKYHNQKAYIFLAQEQQLVRAFVVFVDQFGNNRTETQYISDEQASYFIAHRAQLASQGIHIVDNRQETACPSASAEHNQCVYALPGYTPSEAPVFSYSLTPSPYLAFFDSALLFSTQQSRAPNLK